MENSPEGPSQLNVFDQLEGARLIIPNIRYPSLWGKVKKNNELTFGWVISKVLQDGEGVSASNNFGNLSHNRL